MWLMGTLKFKNSFFFFLLLLLRFYVTFTQKKEHLTSSISHFMFADVD